MKKTNPKFVKTKINPKIIKFAKKFNIQFRVGENLKSCNIVFKEPSLSIPAAYFGEGIIFVRSETSILKEDLDIICLHEVGHALLDLFPLTKKYFKPFEEVAANMVSLSIAAQLKIPLTQGLLKQYNWYNKLTIDKIKK